MAGDGVKTTAWKRVWRGAVDQIGHASWAAAAVAAALLIPVPGLNGAVAGLVLALPRELVDQWPIDRWWDTVIDTAAFVMGGAVVSYLV